MTDAGERPHLVTIQRATVTSDSYGGEVRTWHEHATGWAKIAYGTGQERREAAQENASQAATFMFDWNPTLDAVRVTDRLFVFGVYWDVTGNVTIGGNRECHITAVSTLEAPAQLSLAGDVTAAATAAAILSQIISMAGTSQGSGLAQADLGVLVPLSGQAQGAGAASADLSNAEPGGSALAMMDGTPLLLMDGATTLELMV